MATPLIQVRNVNAGLEPDFTLSDGFNFIRCIDIHSRPGVMRVMPNMAADNDSAIAELVRWFDVYDPDRGGATGFSAELYAYDSAGKIYRRTSSTWALLRTVTSPVGGGQGMKSYQDSLYYATRDGIGQLKGDPTVGGSYTDNFQAFVEQIALTDNAPMVEFSGYLMVGNGRYISRLEPDEVLWNNAVLTLPIGFRVNCMTEWNGFLVIGAKNEDEHLEDAVLFWDGISEFWTTEVKVPKPGPSALFNKNLTLFAFIGGQIHGYSGSEFKLFKQVPKLGNGTDYDRVEVKAGAAVLYKERMLFGLSDIAGGFGDVDYGIYGYGSHSLEFEDALTYEHEQSGGLNTDMRFGALAVFALASGDQPVLYASWHDTDSSSYGIDRIDYDNRYQNSAHFVTQAFEIAQDKAALVQGFKAYFATAMDTVQTRNKLVVKYRIDEDILPEDTSLNWTTLGTIDNDANNNNNMKEILYGLMERAERIQFRVDFTTSTLTDLGPEIVGFDIY